MNKMVIFLVLSGLLLGLPACAASNVQNALESTQVGSAVDQSLDVTGLTTTSASFSTEDVDSSSIDEIDAIITLNGDSINVDGSGVDVAGNIATITAAGTYRVSGTLNNGQLLVDSTAEEKITLLLDGADITSTTSAPVYVINAAKVVIELVQDSVNTLTDGATYMFSDPEKEEPNATLFSNDDLTIKGTGSLTINANYNNGIASDDDLKITGGLITVNAVHDGIKGKSSVSIKDAAITINAGGDGIQSTNAEDTEKGTITIEGGILYITSALDGIQAASTLIINAGDVHIMAGGGSVNGISHVENWGDRGGGQNFQPDNVTVADDTASMKGLKAGTAILISGGTITIDSADDTLNSNESILIQDGMLSLTAGDDGLHADTSITINGGVLDIIQSYEGIESALITINGGNLHIIASDDGINVAGGNDGSAINGRPGQGQFTAGGDYFLYINDGYIYIDAAGDGLDSNGSVEMNGGTVLVNGPTSNGNGALDYMGTFNINAGFLVAVGSSGMAQAPSALSTQYSVMVNFTSMAPAGSLIHFETTDGDPILTFVPAKEYQSVLISTPDITNGSTLLLYYGGTSTGSLQDGLYTGGTYTPGNQITSLDITSVVTGAGSGGGMMPGGGGRGR